MDETRRLMLAIMSIDPTAIVELSTFTGQWFVQTRLWIGDGTILTGVVEHRESVDLAVHACFERLASTEYPEYVAVDRNGQRREYRWNGAAFTETTRPEVAHA